MEWGAFQKRVITAGLMLLVFLLVLFFIPRLYVLGFFSLIVSVIFWEWLSLTHLKRSKWFAIGCASLCFIALCGLLWLFKVLFFVEPVAASDLTQHIIYPEGGVSQTDVKTLSLEPASWSLWQWISFVFALFASLVWVVWTPIQLLFCRTYKKSSNQSPETEEVDQQEDLTEVGQLSAPKTMLEWLSWGIPLFLLFVFWLGSIYILQVHGPWFFISLWVFVWVADTGAYFGGRYLGGPKLAPNVSPGKTISGALCGVLATMIWAVISYYIPGSFMGYFHSFGLIFGLGCVLALVSILGDLYESHIKRLAGVKDSSGLLPGHGGVWDRLDSIISVTPVALLVLLWFI